MTFGIQSKRRRPYCDNSSGWWRRLQQFNVITIIEVMLLWSLHRSSWSRSSVLLLPHVNSFTWQYFQPPVSRTSPRRQWFHLDRYQLPNIPTANTDVRQSLYDPRQRRSGIPAKIYTSVSLSSTSSSSSATDVYSFQNETSNYSDNQNCRNTTISTIGGKNNNIYSTTPIVQNEKIWNSYADVMNDIIHREFKNRNRGAILPPDELTKVGAYLLQNHAILSSGPIDLLSETQHTIRDQLNTKKRQFLQHSNFTKPMYDLYCRCLVYVNDYSARRQVRTPALPAWYKILECGLCPRENAITTCLYVMSMQQRPPSITEDTTASGTNYNENMSDDDSLFKHACVQVATFHDLLYSSNEKTALVRIKGYIADHNVQAAEEVLATLQVKTQETNSQNYEDSMSYKRLRTYQPIFQYYCDTGNLLDAFRIYREMQHTPGVHLIAETYAMLLSTTARHGWFRTDDEMANPIQSPRSTAMKRLKFRHYYGPELLDELCTEMSRDVLELDESCAAMIIEGFNVGFNYSTIPSPTPGWISDISQWFQRFLRSTSNVKKIGSRKKNDRGIFLERVSIDNATAICAASGAKLRLLTLSKHQIRNVHDSLLQMAESEEEKFGEKGKSEAYKRKKANMKNGTVYNTTAVTFSKSYMKPDAKQKSHALRELSLFSNWLRYRAGDPFTAIIDGPNIAYYGHGDVRWKQVEQVLNKLEEMGENPLVIMPQKYLSPKFYIASLGKTQELSPSDLSFINKLIANKKMYVVPSNCLDDYYWMLSSVAEQKSGSNYIQQYVSTDDPTGRFPGLRPLLVTNDRMRDHRLALLEPRLFRRWTSCHIVKYHIEPSEKKMNDEDRVTLIPADFFSREIQCNKASRFADSTVWHIPIAEWPEPDRLCISVLR